jgi:1-deoxy-D-xylulose-5-phosphate synthase
MKSAGATFTGVFSETINDAALTDDRIIGITAAMPDGTGLAKFARDHPERFFDVGIAEQHAVVFAAGLAASGLKPVCAIYSTFLQRAYDPIIHDVALQNLPVRFFLDRSGLVGDDGGTHHGVFDLSYLRCVPNMTILCPRDVDEMQAMTRFALNFQSGPIAVRYPRGGIAPLAETVPAIEYGKAEVLREDGADLAVIGIGAGVEIALNAADLLREKGIAATVVNARFCKPLDEELILAVARRCKRIATVEDNVVCGGFGSAVLELLVRDGVNKPVKLFGLPDQFIEHGPVPVLRDLIGLTASHIAADAMGESPEMHDPARQQTAKHAATVA